MSPPVSDENPDYGRYAPKRPRDHQPMPAAKQLYVATASHSASEEAEPRAGRELESWPEQVPEPPERKRSSARAVGRIAAVAAFAALVALLTILAKPLWQQEEHARLDTDSQTSRNTKPFDRVTATNTLANSTPVMATGSVPVPAAAPVANAQTQQLAIAAGVKATSTADAQQMAVATNPGPVPAAGAQTQQASLSPNQQEPRKTYRGVTDGEIRFGISAPFSGAAKELGQNMRLGIEAAFRVANASGGVFGRQLRLIAADDGYEPTRTAITMKDLYEKEQVFGLVGNVGTPTAAVGLPYALDRKMLFFGAFTGAGLLRSDPPDRYVFNYRASYAEETEAVVNYLVKVRRLKQEQIAVFAQQDAYGDSGFAGVAKAIRSLGGNNGTILRLNYQRNTVDVDQAVAQLHAEQQLRLTKKRAPIKAVIMVPAYRAAAKFIEKTRDFYPDLIYTSVSFVGSTALANELTLLGKRFASGVIVTQVVPALDGHSSLVLDYKSALSKYFPGEAPDYVSLEGYVAANVLIAALKRNGADLDTEKLVATLENLRDLDIGLGTPLNFGRSEHQAVHKVWGTQLDETGHYQPIDLQ